MRPKKYDIRLFAGLLVAIILLSGFNMSTSQAAARGDRSTSTINLTSQALDSLNFDPFTLTSSTPASNDTGSKSFTEEKSTRSLTLFAFRPPVRLPYRPVLRSPYRP